MPPPLLEVRSLTKRFPGVVALHDVSFELRAGEVHALCGENGAGKSTLIKLLAGIHPHGSYEGTVFVDGEPARFAGVRDAGAAGIAVITQEFALVDELSIAENLSVAREKNAAPFLRDISFSLHAGEVLGIGGLMGAGRTELLMHLFGAWGSRVSGTVEMAGEPYVAPSPGESIRRGLVLASEDRRRYGLVLGQSIGFNLSLSNLAEFTRHGVVQRAPEEVRNQHFFSALRIKAGDQRVLAGALSGGSQQKVVLGKALMTRPRVVLFDEPTRGIDVGAKLEVYELINRLTDDGQAVLLVSSELPELMGMSDRILMLAGGRIGGVFDRAGFCQEKLLAAAMFTFSP